MGFRVAGIGFGHFPEQRNRRRAVTHFAPGDRDGAPGYGDLLAELGRHLRIRIDGREEFLEGTDGRLLVSGSLMGETEEEMGDEEVGGDGEDRRAGGEGGVPGPRLSRLHALLLVLIVDRGVGVVHVLLVELVRRMALVVRGEQRFTGRDHVLPDLALDGRLAHFIRILLERVWEGCGEGKPWEGEGRNEQKRESDVAPE